MVFSQFFAFLYCTVPLSTTHTAHATVIRFNHECIQYTAEAEVEESDRERERELTIFWIITSLCTRNEQTYMQP